MSAATLGVQGMCALSHGALLCFCYVRRHDRGMLDEVFVGAAIWTKRSTKMASRNRSRRSGLDRFARNFLKWSRI